MNNAPKTNPIAIGKVFSKPLPSDIFQAGNNKPQKLIETITPPVNPSIPSNAARCTFLKKKTIDEPRAVTSQVKIPASVATQIGFEFST